MYVNKVKAFLTVTDVATRERLLQYMSPSSLSKAEEKLTKKLRR
jgi:hypothetical protein